MPNDRRVKAVSCLITELLRISPARVIDGGGQNVGRDDFRQITLNGAALFAIDQYFEETGKTLPIMISGTVDRCSVVFYRYKPYRLLEFRAPR